MAAIFSLFLVSSLFNNQVTDLGDNAARLASSASFLFLSPLALSFLQFFLDEPDSSHGLKRAIRISLLFYLLAGLGIFIWKGLDEMSGALAIGLGFLLVLMFSMPIFLRQIRISIHQRKDSGKAFMITSIVFSFACYGLIFLMYAALQSVERRAELLLLFQLITMLFALLMTAGIILYNPAVSSTATGKKTSRIPMLTEWEEYSEK
jgi:hypothetical protein